MINEFTGIGNLGTAPVLQKHTFDGESRSVVNVRIYFDRPVRQEDDSYKDKDGFWLTVALWGRLADEAVRLLNRGSRVCVMGRFQENQWTDSSTGEVHTQMQLTADYFFIDTLCIHSVQYQSRTSPAQAVST